MLAPYDDYDAWSFTSGREECYWPSPTYLPPGEYRIGVNMYSASIADTYYPGTFQWEDASPVVIKPGEISSITLPPAPPGVTLGKVVDGQGSPLEGVAISVSRVDCGISPTTSTDVNGEFAVSSSGDRKLFLSKEGYAPTWLDGKPDETSADVVRFRSGETLMLPTVVLQSLGTAGSVAGRVTAGGAASAGTRIEVWTSPAGASPLRTVVPGADGNYEATTLPPGPYLLRFFDSTAGSTFGEKWYPTSVSAQTADPVLVQPGLQTPGIDADLGAKGSIMGTLTENGQRLSLNWAKVCLADLHGNPLRCIYTDWQNDTYRFDHVSPGSYLLAFDAEQTSSWGRWYPNEDSAKTAVPIEVAPGETVTGIDADFPPEGRIEGQVNLTHGTKGAYLALVEGDSDTVRWYGQWYPSGPFAFRVPPGRYRILASSLGWDFNAHYPQWYPGKTLASEAQIIEVLPGQTISGIDMLLVSYRYSRPPALTQPPDIAATEATEFALTLAATDPDGDLLTFGAENLPLGATFDPYSGAFTWTPTCTQAGTYPSIRFTVTDHGRNCGSDALSAEVTVPVSVAARDCAPVLDPIGTRSVVAGETLTFKVTASNPEGGALALEAAGLPAGASFNAVDGTFTWTPGAAQAGEYTVTFAAVSMLDSSLRDEETVTISAAGPLLFSDDFEHSDGADPDWVRLSGFWVVRNHTLRSSPTGIAIAVPGPTDRAGA
ncbi:MAG TPA: putative Ig domain-containing protein, partial [bacterium]